MLHCLFMAAISCLATGMCRLLSPHRRPPRPPPPPVCACCHLRRAIWRCGFRSCPHNCCTVRAFQGPRHTIWCVCHFGPRFISINACLTWTRFRFVFQDILVACQEPTGVQLPRRDWPCVVDATAGAIEILDSMLNVDPFYLACYNDNDWSWIPSHVTFPAMCSLLVHTCVMESRSVWLALHWSVVHLRGRACYFLA